MAEVARDAILTAAILACIFLWAHQPTPANVVQVDYCVVTRKAAGYDEEGKLHFGWVKGYGPCSEQDIYREI